MKFFGNNVSRRQRVMLNTLASALAEVVSMICSLILPRMILASFGSEYNGIIQSITQIISFVTLLRAGVGGVTRAALYKPLAENDTVRISAIINATQRFMRKLAFLFMGIAASVAVVYPFVVKEFDWFFSFSLFMILSISTFVQYYFGITYQMLLLADQRNYVYTLFNIGSVILNTLLGVVLILLGCSIHVVKLGSAVAYALTPIAINWYVRHHYRLDRRVPADGSALSQRWDALGHQIAYYIFTSTNLTLLTVLADVRYVSVFSVYYMVITAIKTVIKTYSSSVEAGFGNVIAKGESKVLGKTLGIFECFMCLSCAFLFTCTAILIVPFVQVYTKGVTDISYYRPAFAVLLVLGELLYCLRIPYMSVVEASGMYKQTRNGAYAEAAINLGVSIVLCLLIDPLIAVATGTLSAMAVRTVEISRFADRNILKRSRFRFYRVIGLTGGIMLISFLICGCIPFLGSCENYLQWLVQAVIVAVIVAAVTVAAAMIFYRKVSLEMLVTLKSLLFRRRKAN